MRITNPSASFTRPADTTAYASGDLVANSTTAGSVVPLTFNDVARNVQAFGMVRRARVQKSGTSVTSASFRLHLYTASPTPANGDNGAWSTNLSGYVGSLDVTMNKAFTDGSQDSATPTSGFEIGYVSAGGKLYGLLEARNTYTPSSGETFTVYLETFQE